MKGLTAPNTETRGGHGKKKKKRHRPGGGIEKITASIGVGKMAEKHAGKPGILN